MKRFFKRFIPPDQWKLPVIILLGALLGLFAYTLKVSNAISYLSDAPETCINCHVMIPEYASWNHSSHRNHASCNDCHVPHDNVIRKYAFKAQDGMRHATFFTFRWEPEVIRIKEAGKEAVQENCIRCHAFVNENITAGTVTLKDVHTDNGKLCWECHREVPHGRVHSLSSTPGTFIPEKNFKTPDWLKKDLDK